MLDVDIQKTINNYITSPRKEKRQRLVLMRKKVITRLCHVCVKPRSGIRVLDLGIEKLSTNSRLSTIPTFNMIKGVIDMTIEGKNLELQQKSVNSKHNRYLFTCLEN